MNRITVAALAAFVAWPSLAQQGAAPFDMGVERRQEGIQDAPRPAPTSPPVSSPAARPSPTPNASAPSAAPRSAAPRSPAATGAPVDPLTPGSAAPRPESGARPPQAQQAPAAPRAPSSPAAAPGPASTPAASDAASQASGATRRFLIPSSTMRLNGEIEQRTWSVYLTGEQAGQGARLHAAYQNSIFAAPESSRLTITINDVQVASEPIASPEQVSERVFEVPAGVLKAGANLVRFGMNQRHRTDCTIESTYELWTDVDPSRTYLQFDEATANRFTMLDDVRAVGVDSKGNTQFRIIAPSLDQLGAADTLMRLAQGLTLVGGMPNQFFTFRKQLEGDLQPGEIAVIVGTADELKGAFPQLTSAANTAAVASFIDNLGANGASALVLSGPSWPAIAGLVDNFVGSVEGSPAQRRSTLPTDSWRGIDTPLLFSGATLDFSALGVPSQEFSGRLFRTNFTIGVPADFYANAYGEARILLDAAYASDVLPGSHIDVFVNGNIASTLPITSEGGAVLQHLPIKLTLRHFRPGVNTITVEAALRTQADQVCAPGATADEKPRFALFGSSQFYMPDFARIAQVPNVAATAGIGFPYFMGNEPVSLFLGRMDEQTLSAAATFAGKLAAASQRVIPLNVTMSAARMAGRNGLFVGSISEMPANILNQLNIDPASRNSWSPDTVGHVVTPSGLTLQDWQQRAGPNFLTEQFQALSDWAKEDFDLSFSALRFAPGSDEIYSPPRSAQLLVAQESDPTGVATWTAVLAPDGQTLDTSMRAISPQSEWEKLSGRISIYSGPEKEVETVPVAWFRFMPTQDLSFSNARLIAANWLSDNIMSYALLLAAGSVLLGLATGGLLSLLGRKSE